MTEEKSSLLDQLLIMMRGWTKPEPEALREAVEELIEADVSETGAPTVEQTLLANILKLRSREVGDCMIPRTDIKAIDINASPQELVSVLASTKHSRIPVYRDTLDDILGMIHIKDLILPFADKTPYAIRDFLRPVLIVVPSMPVLKLLLQMRQKRQHLAIVVDEFGGVDGLVSIEDLVEEIVGEIEDEHDARTTADFVARGDGTLLVDARMPLRAFEEKSGQNLLPAGEHDEIDTLGGYVFHIAGHVPKIGEIVTCPNGVAFEILEADESRIIRLRGRASVPVVPVDEA